MDNVKLDITKLLGLRIEVTEQGEQSESATGQKAGLKAGIKLGVKIGGKVLI